MDKKITPKEAAVAVLKKAEEMLKSSKMAKAMPPQAPAMHKEQDETPVDGVLPEPKASGPHGSENDKPSTGKGIHKLAHFMGVRQEKRKPQEQPGQAPTQPAPAEAAPVVEKSETQKDVIDGTDKLKVYKQPKAHGVD